MNPLRITLMSPAAYRPLPNGTMGTIGWWKGFMPWGGLFHLSAVIRHYAKASAIPIDTTLVDEVIQRDLSHLDSITPDACDLLILTSVQGTGMPRAADIAALARSRGVPTIIGGPHAIMCNMGDVLRPGISVAAGEAEVLIPHILQDIPGNSGLKPEYGEGKFIASLLPLILDPQELRATLSRYVQPLAPVYFIARGCPFICSFCSVPVLAGSKVRVLETNSIIRALRVLVNAGIKWLMFPSDNFNKIPGIKDILRAIIEARLGIRFFVQCDAQIAHDEELVELLGRAGCFQMFVGVESLDRAVLESVHKRHNKPEQYAQIVRLCRKYGIKPHFSNIIGFPGQTPEQIEDHLVGLMELDPTFASFYVMTPEPGTPDWKTYTGKGLLTESDISLFDTSRLVWNQGIPPREMERILHRCYRRFHLRSMRRPSGFIGGAYSALMGFLGIHPMSSGIGPRVIDHADQYQALRRSTYGWDQLPLPVNRS